MPLINIIGAGRLGKTLGLLIVKNKAGSIQAVCNQSIESSRLAIAFIAQGEPFKDVSLLPKADITLITTPDDKIQVLAKRLSTSPTLQEGSVVIHCSGSLSSEVLDAVKSKHCYVASVHPMHSFANPSLSVTTFTNTYCALEGDLKAQEIAKALFQALGANPYTLESDKKVLYHAAGTIASNYLVTLCNQSKLCLQQAGVEEVLAMKIITGLMQSTVNNLATTLSPEDSLTGPIKRGDLETISKHIQTLSPDKESLKFYCEMGLLTLKLVDNEADNHSILSLLKTTLLSI